MGKEKAKEKPQRGSMQALGSRYRDPDPTAVLCYWMHGETFGSPCFEAFVNSCFAYLLHAPVLYQDCFCSVSHVLKDCLARTSANKLLSAW